MHATPTMHYGLNLEAVRFAFQANIVALLNVR
jgi:hypothetical protein